MKKIVWIGVTGLVVLLSSVWIRLERAQNSKNVFTLAQGEKVENRESSIKAAGRNVDMTPSSHSNAFSERDGDTALDEQTLSGSVRTLLLQDGRKHNYPFLLEAISELSYDLSVYDVAALMDMLTWPNDHFPEKMRPIGINAIKNDVLDKLLRQETLPEGLGIQIAEMAGNADNDPVWRDYCIQFMGPFYERASEDLGLTRESTEEHRGKGSENSISSSAAGNNLTTEYTEKTEPVKSVDELTVIREAMFAMLDEREDTLAGTALLGLDNLSRAHEEFDRELISEKAVEIASDEMASTESRMTALRLASRAGTGHGVEGMAETVNTALVLAQTGDTVLMRSAAIVTLGEVGSADDRELLESYVLDSNEQIAGAARMALAKMDSRDYYH